MPRQARVEYEGAIYHVMSRGDRREDIVLDDEDRQRFVKTLGEACGKCGWEVHAWCLMTNHFHLVVETPQGNLVAGTKWLLGTYTMRFNARHQMRGHLFAGRYKSLIVDDADHHYLRRVSDYVHLNPVRAGLVAEDAPLEAYPWSSFPSYLAGPGERPKWLRVDRVLGEHSIQRDDRTGRLEFGRRMEAQRGTDGEDGNDIRRGWRLGNAEFVARLLDRMEGRTTTQHHARERRETMAQKAERIVSEELARSGWEDERLGQERKGHPSKVVIARRLRTETTMTLAWIAERLRMGKWTSVSNLLKAKTVNSED